MKNQNKETPEEAHTRLAEDARRTLDQLIQKAERNRSFGTFGITFVTINGQVTEIVEHREIKVR